MSRKTVLVAGATGLVGNAALAHFATEPDTDVIAISRRQPAKLHGARFIPVDLQDHAQSAAVFAALPDVTHVIYAALYEMPDLVAGWSDERQIEINDRMLRNLMEPLLGAAPNLQHITLLQGTKAYGSHVRPMQYPAREHRSEARDVPNFYWNQEDYLRERLQAQPSPQACAFTIFRPVLIVGYSLGAAMNLVPAIGVYAAMLKARGEPLHYPGGPARPSQAVDAGLLARAMAWAGRSEAARNETFNIANGDIFAWPHVWPALSDQLGMQPGAHRPLSLANDIAPREDEWQTIVDRHGLIAPDLKSFVGFSFEYADYQMGFGRTTPAPVSYSSTIKLMQAGFHEVMDTEVMFKKALQDFQSERLLPP